MKISPFVAFLLAAALQNLPAAPKSTSADDDSPPPPAPVVAPKKTTFTIKGEVAAFTAFSLTLKGPGGQPNRVFSFTENTKIVNDEKPASLAQIKVGKKVGLLAKKIARSEEQLLTVNIGGKLDSNLEKPEESDKKAADTKKSTDTTKTPVKKKKKPVSSSSPE